MSEVVREGARRAVISLGTNSTRLLVVEERAGRLVEVDHRATLTRLGEGLGASGTLDPAAVERTLTVVGEYRQTIDGGDVDLVAITTSVMRRASDADRFAERFREIAGVPLVVLPGDLEARCSFVGATSSRIDAGERVAVLDIGGGSTEIAVGADRVSFASSIELGAVRVTERYPGLAGRSGGGAARAAAERARDEIRAAFDVWREQRAERVIAVAGTPQTLAALLFPDASEHGRLRSIEVATLLDRLLDAPLDERRAMRGMVPQRADILAAGAILFLTALEVLVAEEATLTTDDLLLGYLLLEAGGRRN